MSSSNTSTQKNPTALNSSSVENDLVSVSVDQLIIGRQIRQPIHDSDGVLLLAAGSILTADFKRLLQGRKVSQVTMERSDAETATIASFNPNNATSAIVEFDTELTKKLDSVISSGILFVANTGPAHREKMVFHGKKAYDQQQRESLIAQHQATSESLDNMMKGALHGNRINGSQISSLAASYLTDMTDDADMLLNVANEAASKKELADQSLKMAMLGMALGIEMGLDADNIRKLGVISLVENWGMVRVPEEIRAAPRNLARHEFLHIQKHPIYALELLENVSGMPNLVPLVAYQMHERIDGSGYPRQKKGNNIHLMARILQVADIYVAMTSPRPHRKALMPYAVMVYLLNQAKQKTLDAAVVRSLLQIHSLFPIGSYVVLSDHSLSRVIRRNKNDYMHPIVQRLQDSNGKTVDREDPDQLLDLAESQLEIIQVLPTPGKDEIGILPSEKR